MNEKDTKTVVLDEDLVKEIVGEAGDQPEGEARVVRIDPALRQTDEEPTSD